MNKPNKLVSIGVGTIFVLAALANIGVYLETSTKLPKVAEMLSSVASPETLNFAYRFLFLFAAAVGLWWLEKRLRRLEENHEGMMEEVSEPYVSPQPGEVIEPFPNGVLWRWDSEIGASGPFCPRHREQLFFDNWLHQVKTQDFDEGWLGEHYWFFCPRDKETFKFSQTEVGTIQVKALRERAAARLKGK